MKLEQRPTKATRAARSEERRLAARSNLREVSASVLCLCLLVTACVVSTCLVAAPTSGDGRRILIDAGDIDDKHIDAGDSYDGNRAPREAADDTDDPEDTVTAKTASVVSVYQIWARKGPNELVPPELAKFKGLLLKKTKKKGYNQFKLVDAKKPAKELRLKLDDAQEVKLPNNYRTEFTAGMEKKKCVLKVLLDDGKKRRVTLIRAERSLMLLPIKSKEDWNMVLLISVRMPSK